MYTDILQSVSEKFDPGTAVIWVTLERKFSNNVGIMGSGGSGSVSSRQYWHYG